MADNSVDAIVTDPPYGLSFMGKKWDYDVPSVEIWAECLRVLKPGGHLLAFAGTRTQHRMAVRIEDAGFEIRDMIAWVYGSGFPKSLDVSKAIDKAAGAQREVIGNYEVTRDLSGGSWADLHGKPNGAVLHDITAPATDAARQWQGFGTSLKPALEPVTVARKPLVGTVAENVLAHGTGALNIDGCRVATSDNQSRPRGTFPHSDDSWGNGRSEEVSASHEAGRWPANLIHDGSEEVARLFPESSTTGKRSAASRAATVKGTAWLADNHQSTESTEYTDTGSAARFFKCCEFTKDDNEWHHQLNHGQAASNAESLCVSCATPTAPGLAETSSSASRSEASQVTPACTGSCERCTQNPRHANDAGQTGSTGTTQTTPSHSTSCGYAPHAIEGSTSQERRGVEEVELDRGGAMRFLYNAKASKKDRDEGLSNPATPFVQFQTANGTSGRPSSLSEGRNTEYRNHHPTVKPTDLMRYLCRLVTPPGGTVLDPFTGSGSTGRGAVLEGFNFIGIEREAEYVSIAEARIAEVQRQLGLFA